MKSRAMRKLMVFTAVVVGTVAFACNGDTGAGLGAHDGACTPIGARQVRNDHTTWECRNGDPGDYPNGTWVRIG